MTSLSCLLLLSVILNVTIALSTNVDIVSDNIVARYKDAFAQYQVNFEKHYTSQEEYELRLRAYAVCFSFIVFACMYLYVDAYVVMLDDDRGLWRRLKS